MNKIPRILLLGSNERSALSICRSLGREQMHVDILRFDNGKYPADFSKYCQNSFFLGEPYSDYQSYADKLLTLVRENDYQAIFPINDISNEIIYGCYADLPSSLAVVGPTPEALELASDKSSAIELAKQIGIQAPEGLLLQQGSNFAADIDRLEFPIFVKPTRSAKLERNFINTFEVRKCLNKNQLISKLTEDLPRVSVLLQKELSGIGVGVNFCASNGNLLAATMTMRLHEPVDGGGSSYRCNLPIPDHLHTAVKKLAGILKWSGLMMMELKRDGDKDYIMELNCRPWGSIETGIQAGVNYPLIAVESALGRYNSELPVFSEQPVRVRNLKSDLNWLLKRRGQWFERPSILVSWQRSFFRSLFDNNEGFDLEQKNDIKPALSQFNQNYLAFRAKAKLAVGMLAARLNYRYKPVKISKSSKILFLCRGNINRSAVAECILKNYGFINVKSAGTYLAQGRGISEQGLNYLKGIDISIDKHSSSCVYGMQRTLEETDYIVVFDYRTWSEFSAHFGRHKSKLVLFEQVALQQLGEILDPHGKDVLTYNDCFSVIRAGLEQYDARLN